MQTIETRIKSIQIARINIYYKTLYLKFCVDFFCPFFFMANNNKNNNNQKISDRNIFLICLNTFFFVSSNVPTGKFVCLTWEEETFFKNLIRLTEKIQSTSFLWQFYQKREEVTFVGRKWVACLTQQEWDIRKEKWGHVMGWGGKCCDNQSSIWSNRYSHKN